MALSLSDAQEIYRSLPLPDTSMEPWRFTDLKGFDLDGNVLILHRRYAPYSDGTTP